MTHADLDMRAKRSGVDAPETIKGPQVMSEVSLDDNKQGTSCVLCFVRKG